MEKTNNPNNRELIASLYKNHAQELKRYLLSYTHDIMQAEDMLHDIFIKVMGIDVISDTTSRSLLFTTARNMIADDARHKVYVRRHAEAVRYGMDRAESSVARRVEAADLLAIERTLVGRMAPKRARVYNMYRHDELSADEIALRLNISKRTVETHLYLSSKEIKNLMKNII